jgi:hypothetical protein
MYKHGKYSSQITNYQNKRQTCYVTCIFIKMLHLIPYMNKDLSNISFHFSVLWQISKLLQSGNNSVTLVARHRDGTGLDAKFIEWLLLGTTYIVTALTSPPSPLCLHILICSFQGHLCIWKLDLLFHESSRHIQLEFVHSHTAPR